MSGEKPVKRDNPPGKVGGSAGRAEEKPAIRPGDRTLTGVGTTRRMRHRVEVPSMSHHAESRGHAATMFGLQGTRVEERNRVMMIVNEGEKENRRYSNRDVRKGSYNGHSWSQS